MIRKLLNLMTFTALGQFLPPLVFLYLSKDLNQETFGEYGLFISFSAVLSIFLTLKTEILIPVTVDKYERLKLLFKTLTLGLIHSSLLLLIIGVLVIVKKINYLFLVAVLYALLNSIALIIHEWNISNNKINIVGRNKFLIAFFQGLFTIILSQSISRNPLVIGSLLGMGLSVTILLFLDINLSDLFKSIKTFKYSVFISSTKSFIKNYLPGQILNTISGQSPIWFFGAFFSLEFVGFYTFNEKILGSAFVLLTKTFVDALKTEADNMDHKPSKTFSKFLVMTFFTSLFAVICYQLFGPLILEIFQPKNFNQLVNFSRVHIFIFFLAPLGTLSGYFLLYVKRFELELIWQSLNLILLLICFSSIYLFNLSAYLGLGLFAFTKCVSYSIQIGLARNHKKS